MIFPIFRTPRRNRQYFEARAEYRHTVLSYPLENVLCCYSPCRTPPLETPLLENDLWRSTDRDVVLHQRGESVFGHFRCVTDCHGVFPLFVWRLRSSRAPNDPVRGCGLFTQSGSSTRRHELVDTSNAAPLFSDRRLVGSPKSYSFLGGKVRSWRDISNFGPCHDILQPQRLAHRHGCRILLRWPF